MKLSEAKKIYEDSKVYDLDEEIILELLGIRDKNEYKQLINIYLSTQKSPELTDRDRFSQLLDESKEPRNYEFYTGRWMSEEFILGR